MNSPAASIFKYVSLLLFICIINVVASEEELPELQVHYTFKPEVCERKAKATDVITLHYKGTLKDTNKEFDSR